MVEDLYFRQIQVGPMANFVYFIGSKSAGETLLVDPAWDIEGLVNLAKEDGMEITGALVTHTHQDHVGGHLFGNDIQGLSELLERCKARVYVHKAELDTLPVPASEAVPTDEHTKIEIGGITVECIHTPGHTPGSQCFKVGDSLVSGDTLFIGACGRADLPGSDPGQLYESLTQKLMKLEENTLVFPGHNYAEHATHSSIQTEKATNPYLRFPSKTAFLEAMGFAL